MKIKDVSAAFDQQDDNAKVIEFALEGHSIPTGGHLQGIQRIDNANGQYFVISGSSDHEAYFIIIGETENGYGIIQKKIISYDPYRHAGGIQIMGDYLVVGVEDNSKRDKSRVCIFDISEPEKGIGDPLIKIQREGAEKVSTAGAIAIAERPKNHLLIVGSWDSDTLDFYASNGIAIKEPGCEFSYLQTWNKDKACKSSWCDNVWGNYQNLNLIIDTSDRLFLVGYYCNSDSEDYADLYSLDMSKSSSEILIKRSSKRMKCKAEASFQYGGGIYIDSNENLLVSYACERNCGKKTAINEFR